MTAALLALPLLLGAAPDGPADGSGGPAPFYLQRGTERRTPLPADDVPEAAFLLADLLHDGQVPGFYDGQFAALAGREREVARLAGDPNVHHVIRVMAVMAMAEIADGEPVAAVLEPLLVPPGDEYQVEYDENRGAGADDDPGWIADWLRADLSRYARYALGKDGQPDAVLAKIRELEVHALRNQARTLDPSIDADTTRDRYVAWRRQLHFDIAYLYQQLDDHENARRWFRLLTDNLEGHRITRMCHYNLACIAALEGRPEEAVAALERAFEVGFADIAWMDEDGDLASLHGRADYQALKARMVGEEP